MTPPTLINGAGNNTAHLADLDGDGDLDLVAQLSQEREEVLLLPNDGAGHFATSVLYKGDDACWGMADLALSDMDSDGDIDILFTNGDAFDSQCVNSTTLNRHALWLLRNDGKAAFGTAQKLASRATNYTCRRAI